MNGESRVGRVLAIAGCTNSGKTTIAEAMKKMLIERNGTVEIIHQDDFFMEKEKVNKILLGEGADPPFYYNYDCPTSIDGAGFQDAVGKARNQFDYVIIEGNMITEFEEIVKMCDQIIFLILDKKTCTRRRDQRSYDPPDLPGYFEQIVWPVYVKHLQQALATARTDRRISFLDVSSDNDQATSEAIFSLIRQFTDDILRITTERLDVEETLKIVNSPSCGAESVFVGTTRDTFNGRKVIRLDYECYDDMAYRELRKLCAMLRKTYTTLERIVIFHRVGTVPVGEASVVITIASAHRKEAIAATELAIDELKRTVPIWKKEIYEDGGCSWKENTECCGHGGPASTKKLADVEKSRNENRKIFWLPKH